MKSGTCNARPCFISAEGRRPVEQLHLEQLREKANMLPLKPGVYLMLDKTGAVIYVGKAKKLKNRR